MKGLLIYFDIIEGKQAAFEEAAAVLISRVRANDPGYQLYSLAKMRDHSARYVLVQRFESYETQLAHQGYPYVLETLPAMNECIVGLPTVEWLDIID